MLRDGKGVLVKPEVDLGTGCAVGCTSGNDDEAFRPGRV